LCETYIRDHLARAMGASPARIDTQQSLGNLGLDSLIAVDVRNRINADLRINVPLEKFMQGASIHALAAYVAERLLEGDRSERAKAAVRRIATRAGADIPETRKDAVDLSDRVDELGIHRNGRPETEVRQIVSEAGADIPVTAEDIAELHERIDELASKVEVRRATTLSPAQLREAALMLSHAFHDDPLIVSVFPDVEHRPRASEAAFAALLKDGVRHGLVDLAYEDGGIAGVLIAYPPGSYPMSWARTLRMVPDYLRIAAVSPTGLLKLLRTRKTLSQFHPKQPHYYALLAGVAPGQLNFTGPILAKRLTDLAADNGMPVYLVAQKRSTVDVYARYGGCKVLQEGLEMYPGGPLTWTMWREVPARKTLIETDTC
jgi:acyl carrier protein